MTQTKKNDKKRGHLLHTLFFWTKKQKKELTLEEKTDILKNALAKFFADHDKVSGEVNLFPLTRANEEVEKMKKEGTFDYYFEWFLLQEEYLRKIAALQTKYSFKKVNV